MNVSLKILRLLRWLARSVVVLGIAFLFGWGIFMSPWQGFSPDGPPPGFKPVPSALFALIMLPRMLWLALVEAPWIARPILAYVVLEVLWRYAASLAMKHVIGTRICKHASVVLMALVAGGGIYSGLALYAHRRGPAEFCILNGSHVTCQNVMLEGDGFSVPLGTMLPGERCFASVRPQGRSPVAIRCQANGTNTVMSFTGGLEDSRKYYYQFTIGRDLRGEFGAWRLRDRPWGNDIVVSNDKSSNVSNIVVSGLGFTRTIPNLPGGAKQHISVYPKKSSWIFM